jgi:heat shock protein HslJ
MLPKTVLVSVLAGLTLGLVSACNSQPPAAAAAPASSPALEGQTWTLQSLEGVAVTVSDERGRPTLQLDGATTRASGLAGVNRFSGSYTREGTALKFGPLAMTKMAGPPERMDLETRYSRALTATTQWRIAGGALELLAGERVVARFSARNP